MIPNEPNNLYTIVKALERFATTHKQINAFEFGPLSDADIAKLSAAKHPLLHVTCLGADIDEGTASLDFQVMVGTMQPPDLESRMGVLSNMLYVFKDVIAFLKHHQYDDSFVNRVTLELPVSAESFVVNLDNQLVGWSTVLTLSFDNTNDLCLIPD